jgi:hypothetical protein
MVRVQVAGSHLQTHRKGATAAKGKNSCSVFFFALLASLRWIPDFGISPEGRLTRWLLVVSLTAGLLIGCAPRTSVPRQPQFAELSAQLSEDSGYFPSDNLISNEEGYQTVLDKLSELNARGGVYIGVGPEQNFTYIAHVRPTRAFILDIRRDNMLQHLLYKALFVMARNRAEFLSLWTSRPLGRNRTWLTDAPLEDLIALMDKTDPNPSYYRANLKKICNLIERRFRVRLTEADRGRLDFIYKSFYEPGLGIRYESHIRRDWRWFPTLKSLLLETDRRGRQRTFLASEEDFQFLKRFQERDLLVPVTGDFAGPKALRAMAEYIRQRGERVSVFYVSNVEFYLLQQNSFSTFVESVKTLPHDERTIMIRSYLGFGHHHPETVPGHLLATLLQRMDKLIELSDAGLYRSYSDIGLLDYIPTDTSDTK